MLARQLRTRSTSAERRLWRALRNRSLVQWKFRRQEPIDRFVVDFVCISARLIVEVDGATHSTPDELRYDAERTKVLEACGFHVLRVSNSDIYANLDGVLDTILAELEQRTHL